MLYYNYKRKEGDNMEWIKDNKKYEIPDKEVDKYVDEYNCSIVEACEFWIEDHDKSNKKRNYVRSGEPKKPRKPREKKENPLKKEIISAVFDSLVAKFGENAKITVRNDEKYIDFVINDRDFTINLVKHRKE